MQACRALTYQLAHRRVEDAERPAEQRAASISGQTWSAVGESDVLFVECKWTSRPVGTDELASLERTAAAIELPPGARRWFGLCARSGFTDGLLGAASGRDDVLLFDLATIVGG